MGDDGKVADVVLVYHRKKPPWGSLDGLPIVLAFLIGAAAGALFVMPGFHKRTDIYPFGGIIRLNVKPVF